MDFESRLKSVDAVLLQMMKLKNGEHKILNKEHKNYDKFVNTVKDIIDYNLTKGLGFCLEFNDDYSKVYKRDINIQ